MTSKGVELLPRAGGLGEMMADNPSFTFKKLPKRTIEVTVKITPSIRFRYWLFKVLVRLALWIINADAEFVTEVEE